LGANQAARGQGIQETQRECSCFSSQPPRLVVGIAQWGQDHGNWENAEAEGRHRATKRYADEKAGGTREKVGDYSRSWKDNDWNTFENKRKTGEMWKGRIARRTPQGDVVRTGYGEVMSLAQGLESLGQEGGPCLENNKTKRPQENVVITTGYNTLFTRLEVTFSERTRQEGNRIDRNTLTRKVGTRNSDNIGLGDNGRMCKWEE